MSPLNGLKGYLQMHAKLYAQQAPEGYFHGIPGLLLEHGEVFEGPGSALDEEEFAAVYAAAKAWPRGFALKECFYNAQRLVMSGPDLAYYEGFATGPASIPVYHAWVVINGKVVDLTWRKDAHWKDGPLHAGSFLQAFALGVMPEEAVYIGVVINASEAHKRMAERQECNPYLDDWREQNPLLRRSAWEK